MPGFGQATYGGAAYVPLVTGTNPFRNFWSATKVEIGFGSTALADPPTWTDVTIYVRRIGTSRGRQHELSRFEAGTVQLVLNNRDGRFSSWNTSSPYSPNVLPFVQVRITAVWDGVTYPIFRGHIDSWPLKWSTANDSDVTVHCVDGFKMLNLKKASSLSNYAATVTPDAPSRWFRLDEAAGATTVADSSGNGATGSVFYDPSTGSFPTDIAATFGTQGALVASPSGAFDCGTQVGGVALDGSHTFSTNFTIELWVKLRQAGGIFFNATDGTHDITLSTNTGTETSPVTTIRGTVRLDMDTVPTIVQISGSHPIDDGNWHHVVMINSAAGGTVSVYVDGFPDGSSTAATMPSFTGRVAFGGGVLSATAGGVSPDINGAIDECAIYLSSAVSQNRLQAHYKAGARPREQELSGARINAFLDQISWPATLRAIDIGNSLLQAAGNDATTQSALTNMQAVADTEGGQLFISAAGNVVFYGRSHTSASPNGLPAVTLGDGGTTGPAGESPYLVETVDVQFDDLDLWNETSVTPAGQGAQIFGDTTSQTTYGKRTLAKATIHYSAAEALGQATWNTNVYKNPLQRIRSLTFEPKDDPSVLFPAALGFELLTRIQFKRRPKDGSSSTFTQQALIEGIEHVITPGGWQTTWRLSPTDASPVFWIIDDPVAGKIVDGATQNPPVAIGY